MIEVTDLHKTYKMGDVEVRALNGVTLTIEPGEFVAIMGPSGSGKSTLMHVFGLLDVPDSGSYKLFGKEVSKLSEDELAVIRSRTVGFVFQQFNLLARRTALQNVALPLIYSHYNAPENQAKNLLEKVGLGSRSDHKPSELSGGQQQRVAIARALTNDPLIIFADEPTGNLDSASEEEIMRLLTQLNETGITIVLVTHEPEIAQKAKRIIRMRDGKVQSDEKIVQAAALETIEADEKITSLQRTFTSTIFFKEVLEHFRQALSSLISNKIRAMLSMLGILIGVGAVIAMLALGTGARQSVEAQLASLGSNLLILRPGAGRSGGVSLGTGTVSRLTLDDANEAKNSIPGIKRVAPSVSGRGQAVYQDKNWNTQIMGVTSDYPFMRAAEPTAGRFFQEEEDQKRARIAVIGKTVVRQLFGESDPLGEYIKINKVIFQVIGVLPEKGANGFRDQDDVIVIPLNTAMRRLLGKDYVDSIDIEVENPEEISSVQAEILSLVNRRHRVAPSQQGSFDVRNMADIQAALSETSKTLSWLLASIATISLVVGGIGIMNIMLVSVTERTREIGLRKAIGAKRRDILAQFLIEAMVVSVTGGLIGITLGWTVTFLMSKLAGWAAYVSLSSVVLSFLFSGTVGIVFGLWPAKKASLLNPIEALRHE